MSAIQLDDFVGRVEDVGPLGERGGREVGGGHVEREQMDEPRPALVGVVDEPAGQARLLFEDDLVDRFDRGRLDRSLGSVGVRSGGPILREMPGCLGRRDERAVVGLGPASEDVGQRVARSTNVPRGDRRPGVGLDDDDLAGRLEQDLGQSIDVDVRPR